LITSELNVILREISGGPVSKKDKKLVLNKNTVKNMKLQTEIKAGGTAAGCSGGELSKLDCQSKLAFTNTCINCSSSTIFQGPTVGC
jgi:hypothetical protein